MLSSYLLKSNLNFGKSALTVQSEFKIHTYEIRKEMH